MRRLVTRNQYRTDNQVDCGQFSLDIVGRRVEGLHILRKHVAQVTQARQVNISNQHFSTHTGCDDSCVSTYDTTTQNQYASGQYTRNATHQFAFTTLGFLQETGTLLNRHTSGNLTHRNQQRQ